MNAENPPTLDQSSTQRRAWEAPEVVTVVPIDRTEGGLGNVALEVALYKRSS